jgi:TolB-like protein/tetratricopeptide (TPR) repeat protein
MSSPSDSKPHLAAFLSYAREDAAPARRLAESLRAGGIEIWFDENELRGGDVWDRAIRRQIRDCALFIPIISAHTQARLEGYFRLEWKLAEDRSHLMAKGKPFIVPVCIDDTPERDAVVPDSFLALQWTRLPEGETPPRFVQRVQHLLAGGSGTPARAESAGVRPEAPTTVSRADPRIPDYELLRQIGSGSYGDVWLARGLTGAHRAVKIVWRDRFPDAEPFEREFRGLKEFTALGLEASQMALLHVGRDERAGFFYYVMELADDASGGSALDPARYVPLTAKELKARRGRLPAAECVAFGVALARSLAGLHARQLLHRDIKPSNVIVVGGVPKLADIGLVSSSTEARSFVGTEGYLPPEGPGAPSADVFALGKVLYELATGLDRTEYPKLPDDLGEPGERRALFRLNDVLLRASDAAPGRRYRDAAALLADLSALEAGGTARRPRRWPYGALAACVALGAVAFFARRPAAPTPPAAPVAPKVVAPVPVAPPAVKPRGIAVLPFENLGADEQAFFAAGVTEEVSTTLGKIRTLRVLSRAAVLRFQGGAADLPRMTVELGIGAILTGSVRHAGDLVRISVQLLAAPSGETLWSEQYNGNTKDVFSVQSDVAVRVARAMQASLAPEERARIQRPPTENTAAYELFLKDRTAGHNHTAAIDLLQQAIALDGRFALAHSRLARRYLWRSDVTGPDDRARALATAQKAVALDPQLPQAHHALGNSLGAHGRIDEGRLALQRATELDASFQAAFSDLSVLEANAGRLDLAVYWAKRAFVLAPNLANSYYHLGAPLFSLDQDSTERWLKAGAARFAATKANPGELRLEIYLALIELYRGQPDAALARMRSAAALAPGNPEVRTTLDQIAFFAGAPDARERIDQALKTGPGGHSGFSSLSPRTMRAFLWRQSGDRTQAQPLIDAALKQNTAAIAAGDRSNLTPYENAALHLIQGDTAAALEWLEKAVNAGFSDPYLLKASPIFAPLRREPRFIQMIERINRDLGEMKQRIDVRELEQWAKGIVP